MAYKRILTIQDISCVGQCSMTVAMPILSACGHETCILPTALLSTHTGGISMMHWMEYGSIGRKMGSPLMQSWWAIWALWRQCIPQSGL